MKKTLVITALFAALALVGCGKEEPKPEESSKITFQFTMADDSIVPASYASVYLAGPMTGWATGMNAPVFVKEEGESKVYRLEFDAPEDPANWINGDSGHYDYQLVLGYNESSNMPASKLGLQWVDAYKADQTTSGTSNPYYEWDGVATTIDLGVQKWSTQVATPEPPIENVTFVLNLSEALPAGYNVCCPGSWDGWKNDISTCTMTPNEDRTSWSLHFDEIFADSYEFQFIAVPEGSEALVWDYKSEANANGNFTATIGEFDAESSVDLLSGDTTTFVFGAAE